ncbi:hypothetical protein PCASD_23588 [Puccinia coronata f. sp. avenae]|uniref:Uncharacterized protein n=1 Tax=Puccinia coronata f. sp. avenae TaxID=200324 RepID=A0A2N5TUY7_9BASI|nr:hypothetical protein PCASD_23588 [Puccinia coronata f. sp. avenae]
MTGHQGVNISMTGHQGVETFMTGHQGVDTSTTGHGGVNTSMTMTSHGGVNTSMTMTGTRPDIVGQPFNHQGFDKPLMALWKYCSNSPLSLHHFFLTRYKITLSLTLSIPPSFNSPLSVKSQRPAFIGNSSYPVLSFGLFEIHEIDTSELSARAESGHLSYKSTTLFLRKNRNITLEVKLHALSLRIDALKKDHVYFASGKHYKPYNISRTGY